MSEETPPSYSQATQATVGALPQPAVQSSVQLPAQPQMFWTVGPNGQPQMFYAPAGMPAQPISTPQGVAYVSPNQPAVQPVSAPLPVSLQPYSFLTLSLIFMVLCSILNITALVFGIPALFFSLQSEDQKRAQQYERAKRSGAMALALTLMNMTYAFITITIAVGIAVANIYN